MTKTRLEHLSREKLESRIEYLEEQVRQTLDILDMAATLGDFQTSINKLREPDAILRETMERIRRFLPFVGIAFFLVDENSSDFELAMCDPARYKSVVQSEVHHLIETGVFALALREHRPLTVYSRDKKYRLILHSLATNSRTRGMFVGLRGRDEHNVTAVVLSLLTIVLKNCANAIESFELYRLLRRRQEDSS